jgi:drug/metabolite transporter (DMT)-like permease
MTQVHATLAGTVAILLWSLLAVLTAFSGAVPALQLTAFSFGLGFLLALGKWLWRGESIRRHLTIPAAAWAVGVGGLFGYHALYFLALRLAPPVEASLLNYLWPLLIVLFSALLPGERLRMHHIAGAAAGLAGTVLLVAGSGVDFASDGALGYAAAFACAFIWSGYSVLSRRMAAVPTDSVGGFCLATALLALVLHLLLEQTVWPETALQWAALVALGLGPAGSAFFFWDVGMKRGDIRALGVAAYATPLLSTSWLLLMGFGQVTAGVIAAAVLITGGGLLGARDLLRR